KAAIELQHARRERAMHQSRQATHRLVIDVEIDAGVFVGEFCHGSGSRSRNTVAGAKGRLSGGAPRLSTRRQWHADRVYFTVRFENRLLALTDTTPMIS